MYLRLVVVPLTCLNVVLKYSDTLRCGEFSQVIIDTVRSSAIETGTTENIIDVE